MEGILDTPTLAVISGLIVLIVGCAVRRWFNKAKYADRNREYWDTRKWKGL